MGSVAPFPSPLAFSYHVLASAASRHVDQEWTGVGNDISLLRV